MMKNNSLKMLAETLAKNGIASLRYDKRGIGESKASAVTEQTLVFENYTEDAKSELSIGSTFFTLLPLFKLSIIGNVNSSNCLFDFDAICAFINLSADSPGPEIRIYK